MIFGMHFCGLSQLHSAMLLFQFISNGTQEGEEKAQKDTLKNSAEEGEGRESGRANNGWKRRVTWEGYR